MRPPVGLVDPEPPRRARARIQLGDDGDDVVKPAGKVIRDKQTDDARPPVNHSKL